MLLETELILCFFGRAVVACAKVRHTSWSLALSHPHSAAGVFSCLSTGIPVPDFCANLPYAYNIDRNAAAAAASIHMLGLSLRLRAT